MQANTTHSPQPPRRTSPAWRHSRGLSLVELMIALTVTAMLMTATMVAIDASFKAYASAAEQASAQAATRMVTNRTMTLIRNSTAHGPLTPNATVNPPVVLNAEGLIESNHIEMLYPLDATDPQDDLVRIEYRAASQELWLIITPSGGGAVQSQPLLGGVTNSQFAFQRRLNDEGLWILERATFDVTVLPDDDATLAIEAGPSTPIRLIASTMPRKLD